MATRFSNALFPDNSTAAHFQAWAQFIEDTLVATGAWTVSVETGDTPPGSLAIPTAANQKKGFRVYRIGDSNPTTFVVRIDFGSSGATNTPGIWLTIGAGTNGAGVVTAPLWNGGASAAPNVSCGTNQSSGGFNSYGSAFNNRAAICMFVQSSNAQFPLCFMIERNKNPSGNDQSDGLLLIYRDGQAAASGLSHSRFLINAGGAQPTAEFGLNYILTRLSPSETFGGDIGVGIVSHFKGVAQQPGTNLLITNAADVSAEATVSIGLYNQTRTYVQLSNFPPYKALVGTNVIDSSARCLMRYD